MINQKVKKGNLLAFTTGNYSDYTIMAIGRATRDFDLDEVSKPFEKPKSIHDSNQHQPDEVLNHLVNTLGLVEELHYQEVVIGVDYTWGRTPSSPAMRELCVTAFEEGPSK